MIVPSSHSVTTFCLQEEGKICKLGLPCCVQSLFKPEPDNLVKCGWDCLCLDLKGQFPFGEDMPGPICAVYGLQCSQKDGKTLVGCCNPPYEDGAMKFLQAGAPPANESISR